MPEITAGTVMGYFLGIVIILVSARIFFAPFKLALKILINSAIGGIVMFVINSIPFLGIYMGINLVSALVVGILGIPGLCLLLIAQVFF